MDDQYLDAFIRESEEELTKLNNSLLALESDPSDREAMEQIFRTAHTLKGNFGAMGFDAAAELAHAMEDLLDEMREGQLEVTPDVMDLVFAGVDELEAIVGEIEEHGEPQSTAEETVATLRATLEEADETSGGEPDDEASETAEKAETTTGVDVGDFDVETTADAVVHVEAEMAETDMPGVDAMLAMEQLGEVFDVLDTRPDRAAIEDGDYDRAFEVVVGADGPGRVDTEVDSIGEIGDASVTDVTEAVRHENTDADDGESKAEAGASESEAEDTSSAKAGGGSAQSVDEIKSVRVDVNQLDDLHGLVEQLVTSRIKLRRAVEENDLDSAGETLGELDKITGNLQNTVMDMRLIPLKKVVGKFPRMVRDLSRELDKEVDFEIEGEDIELDRTILTEISDPLMHIIRNALDHGIEPPEERERLGKPREGSVTLRASRERDHVVIRVEDDGGGLDVEEIRRQAIEQGVRSAEELETMDDSAIYDLVFHPGFSTADEVTDTSGRGVGMDVVHDTVTQLDGSVDVESTPGEGTTVSLRLPVTMAIVKVLFVEVGDEEYGIPIKNVDEITRTEELRQVNGRDVIKHNDEIYPVIDLGEIFDVPGHRADGARARADGGESSAEDGGDQTTVDDGNAGTTDESGSAAGDSVDPAAADGGDGMLIRIRESERRVALKCDSVNAQEEVVVKPLEGILSGTRGLSGTAVLGDGNIVHILDVVTL